MGGLEGKFHLPKTVFSQEFLDKFSSEKNLIKKNSFQLKMTNEKFVDANIFWKSELQKETLHLKQYRKLCGREEIILGKVHE